MLIKLPKADYEFNTLVRVAHRLGKFFLIKVTSKKEEWHLHWEVSDDLKEESELRIRNEIYDQVIRDSLHKETKPIKNLIFAAAFSNIDID